MEKLFKKHSNLWFIFVLGLFILNLSAIVGSAIIVESNLHFNNVVFMVALASVISIFIIVGGLLKFRLYYYTALLFDVCALIYMLYISIGRTAEGWTDIVSIISYMFVAVSGIILGIIVQLIYSLAKRRK